MLWLTCSLPTMFRPGVWRDQSGCIHDCAYTALLTSWLMNCCPCNVDSLSVTGDAGPCPLVQHMGTGTHLLVACELGRLEAALPCVGHTSGVAPLLGSACVQTGGFSYGIV